jgi:hypothetical protein
MRTLRRSGIVNGLPVGAMVGYGLSLEGASAAELVKSVQANSERVAWKGQDSRGS